jgi:quercetin dioxygenase-like cupin family protein
MSHHAYGATGAGTVMLDIGADTGALILWTQADLLGAEIEISPHTLDARRTHAAVRERPTPRGTRYAVVYMGLTAGQYTIWKDHDTPAATVTITGGQITSHKWTGED